MKQKVYKPAVVVAFLFLAAFAWAQGSDKVIESARTAYKDESFEKAFSAIAEGIPESVADSAVKRRTAEFLSEIGVQEYGIKNYKNAYDSFRKALKYDPTNAQSSSYFVRMRREMNVASLKNEAPPRVKAVAAPAPEPAPAAAAAPQPAPQPAAVPASNVELKELKGALEEAGTRLKTMESSVSATSEENKILKGQVDQQLKLIQTFMEKQASAAAVKPAAPAAPAQTAQEKALIAKTMELLAKMSEKEAAPPQVVVQSDPGLKDLVEKIAESQKNDRASGNSINVVMLIVAAIAAAALIGIIVIVLIAVSRSRKRNSSRQYENAYDKGNLNATVSPGMTYSSIAQAGGNTPLLEFIDSAPQQTGGTDFAVRKDLLKAERLNRMFEEVRAGTLSWNTVRQYIGELDVSLRTEILKVVERKLDEGDLVSTEAILPVIFPFLTDYDDFVREKSEKLARRALVDLRKSSGTYEDAEVVAEEAADPLEIRTLMNIPKKLQVIFKNHDQTLMTAKISRGIGTVLGLSTEERNMLYKSALAHDCGYLMVDQDRLVRTIAKQEIDEEDFSFIRTHAFQGPSFFGGIELPEAFKAGIVYHHERNDGTGYPEGLKKGDIPLFAKIIGIAETFTALVSKRSYRDKREVAHALAIISDGARAKFDQAHVEALVKVASSIGRP